MKKMKWAVVCAALASAFGFSSCLDNGESGPQTAMALVTVSSQMGIPVLLPDCAPGITLLPSAADLTQYGISGSARRAIVTYSIPEGQEITESTKNISINLVAGSCMELPTYNISNAPDTFDTKGYTSKIQGFINVLPNYPYDYPWYPTVYAGNGYLTFGYLYKADKEGSFGMKFNRISNDTLYLDFKAKVEGASREGIRFRSYSLNSLSEYYQVHPVKDDSIRITISAESDNTSMGSKNGVVSVTTAVKR